MSVGDFILSFGLMLTVQHCMAKYSIGKHARGSLARHMGEKPAKKLRKKATKRKERPVNEVEPAPLPPPVSEVMPEFEPEPQPAYYQEQSNMADIPAPLPAAAPPTPAGNGSPGGLSPRLDTVAGLVPRGFVVADVGCDHGKLAIWLAMNGAPFVVALDVSAKSLTKTKVLVEELNLQNIVQTRVGDGLKKLRPGEADVIVIAGLGGPTICSILESSYNVAGAALRLVLQPMNAVGEVRRWLADNGFCIVAEQLAQDDGRIYQVLAAEPGSDGDPPMSLFDLEVGHLLIENRHPLLPRLLEFKIATIDKILAELAGKNSNKADARRSELISLQDRCAEVLESLDR